MATYVLVHGAWQGASTWIFVEDGLHAKGHTVHTPTMSGAGIRRYELRPDIAYPFVKTEKAEFLQCMVSFLGDDCERGDPRPFFRLVPAPVAHPTRSRPRGGHLKSSRVAPPSQRPIARSARP